MMVSLIRSLLQDRRESQRFPITARAMYSLGRVRQTIDIVDISRVGLKGRAYAAPPPACGNEIKIKLIDARILRGEVIWVAGAEFGVRFLTPLAGFRHLDQMDELGSDFYRGILEQQLAMRDHRRSPIASRQIGLLPPPKDD